ncbi:aldehyde dehydrogenase [Mycolicibacterium sp. 050232]|uniref:aldehyde dehydrogenase n=1 Tax=Mycolicibacterium sp. 050232 TaxID=3113982 RepID=UPI002E27B58D|nr:aldehyde dehydrogenase [Mycolicibacterium sp. 050232]MED5810890.1 aldehyde dehydrogenase [Mycolicibacterium sp. 050232]
MAELWREAQLLIDGRLVAAADGDTYDNINPATERTVGVAPDGTAADMDAAVAAARRAFDESGWADDPQLRVRCIRQLHDALIKHSDELRETLVAEVGCPVALTYGPQLDSPLAGLGWVADLAENYRWERDLGEAAPFGMKTRRTVRREPVGVVGAITPWNYPVQINLAKTVPALAAGNTVVLKPAPDTPYSATLLGRLIHEHTDIPAGVVNVVTSAGHDVGRQLCEDPRVDMISFTGSTATGTRIMIAAAPTIKKVFLELGGKSALVALDDADITSVVTSAAFAATTHAGQGCANTTRLLLPRARYQEGVEALAEALNGWPYGDPTDSSVLMGPLIREEQRQRVLGYIRKGVEEGAQIAAGGGVPAHLPTGYYVEPTLLTDVDPDSTVAQEEIFGPVLVAIPHDGDDHAVAIANNSRYGLSGAVVSASDERARAVANRMRTGTVNVNGGVFYSADVPFGGYKHSGIGREMGVAGFEEYLEIKSIAERAS